MIDMHAGPAAISFTSWPTRAGLLDMPMGGGPRNSIELRFGTGVHPSESTSRNSIEKAHQDGGRVKSPMRRSRRTGGYLTRGFFFDEPDFREVARGRQPQFTRHINGCCRPGGRVERIYFLSHGYSRGAVKSLGPFHSGPAARDTHLSANIRKLFFGAGHGHSGAEKLPRNSGWGGRSWLTPR